MRVLAVVVLATMSACGGAKQSASTAGPVSPAPPIPQEPPQTEPDAEPAKPDQVAIADPDDGGEIAEDPDAGGEIAGQSGLGVRGAGPGGGGIGTSGVGTGGGVGQGYGTGIGGPGPSSKNSDAQVRFGTVTVKGELDSEIVRRVIRRHANQLRFCLAKRLEADPNASGLLTLRLVIGRDGSVAKADATGVHPEVVACVSRRAMTWVFPKPKSGVVVVSQPINMSPR